jgi:hypothetical protein
MGRVCGSLMRANCMLRALCDHGCCHHTIPHVRRIPMKHVCCSGPAHCSASHTNIHPAHASASSQAVQGPLAAVTDCVVEIGAVGLPLAAGAAAELVTAPRGPGSSTALITCTAASHVRPMSGDRTSASLPVWDCMRTALPAWWCVLWRVNIMDSPKQEQGLSFWPGTGKTQPT